MKYVIRSLLFHFTCILFFGYIYTLIKSEFTLADKESLGALDCFFLSTTIQSGVGYSLVTPITEFSKLVIILQIFFMMSANVCILYFFTANII